MTRRIIIRHGTIVDQQGERRGDVVVEGDTIIDVGVDVAASDDDVVVLPGPKKRASRGARSFQTR